MKKIKTFDNMDKTEKIIIKDDFDKVMAVMYVNNLLLHGRCKWYNGRGELVSDGEFQNGKPYTGTFINWSNFLGEFNEENPYDTSVYCKDWITRFELSFRSEYPKYDIVLENYYEGEKVTE